jgi:hypothetical protein
VSPSARGAAARRRGSKRFAKEISGLKMKLYDRDADAAAGD